jgi:hypothetical protein
MQMPSSDKDYTREFDQRIELCLHVIESLVQYYQQSDHTLLLLSKTLPFTGVYKKPVPQVSVLIDSKT